MFPSEKSLPPAQVAFPLSGTAALFIRSNTDSAPFYGDKKSEGADLLFSASLRPSVKFAVTLF